MTSKEWKTYKLSDFMEFNPRETLAKGTIAKKIAMENLQPFCRDVCQYEYAPYNGGVKFKNGDTIMARITPCLENGKTSKVNILEDNEIAFGSTEYIVFRKRDNISDENFIYYLVTSPKIREIAIKSMVGSSGRQRVQADVLADLELELPPLETQEKIARVLSSLDNKIELNNKINKNLEQQAQAIFKSWFVDFKNPKRKTCKAEEYFNISIGKTPPRKEPEWFSQNSIDKKWVSISDMGNCGVFILNSSEYLKNSAIDKFNIVLVPKDTVILSFKLTIGRVAITNEEVTTNEAIAHFKTDNKKIKEYLYCYLKNYNFQTMGSTSSIATAVNSKIIKSMPFIIPADDEIEKFHQVAKFIFEKIRINQIENEKLTQLRDTLLPKLMNGEIDVDKVGV